MEYKGKVYAKINGRYLECTQSVSDLEKQIEYLKSSLKQAIAILHNIGFEGDISHIIKAVKNE